MLFSFHIGQIIMEHEAECFDDRMSF
jgi:hypothetical protein